jgi:hypothetical protein
VCEVKKSENLRYWLPERVVNTTESEDFSEFEYLWTTNRVAKNIAAFLRLNGFTVDFKTSTVSKDGGKNNQKVGRILNVLNPKLLESWKKLTNNSFSTKSSGEKRWVISANPIDIAGSSYKRKWSSCTADGHHMVRMANNSFSFIAYLCDKKDTEIKNPHCRYFIHVGMPSNKQTTTKLVHFDISGDNVPPGRNRVSLTVPDNTSKSGILTGVFFIDTKYGNCSASEFGELSDFIKECNDVALNLNGLTTMNIKITGLYVNTYTLPYKVSLSTKVAKPKTPEKTTKTIKKVDSLDSLANRVRSYRKYSNRPTYELVEYVINTGDFSNQYLNDAIFGDKDLAKYIDTNVIDSKLEQSKGNIDINKQKMVLTNDYSDIVKITEDIRICVDSYNSLLKIREDVSKAVKKATEKTKLVKA